MKLPSFPEKGPSFPNKGDDGSQFVGDNAWDIPLRDGWPTGCSVLQIEGTQGAGTRRPINQWWRLAAGVHENP